MPSSDTVSEQLADIVARVLGSDPADVVPDATFKSLGADSLTIVEIGEELGRRFDVYLADERIDQLRTVQDAVNAVVRHDGSRPGRRAHPPVPATFTTPYDDQGRPVALAPSSPAVAASPIAAEEVERRAWHAARWLGILGVLIGGAIGLVFAVLVGASGIDEVSLPPLPASTTSPTPTETTPSPKPSPSATTEDPTPEPTLTAAKSRVAPGERFVLSGRFPELGSGAKLQVEVRENGGSWDEFPVTAVTRGEGEFKTELYTSRTGDREFRIVHEETGDKTPVVKVTIG